MAALLRRRPRVHVLPVHLGETPIATLAAHVQQLLVDRHTTVVLDIVSFEFFDERTLAALSSLIDSDKRIDVRGLDAYAESLLTAQTQPAGVVDVRTAAERSLIHLDTVSVLTAAPSGTPMDDATWDDALTLAGQAGRRMVTLDLRGFPHLSPHQALSLAEFSADLAVELRVLIIVNASAHVADQLRVAGLHGELLLGTDEPTEGTQV